MVASKLIRITPDAFKALMKHAKGNECPAAALHRVLGLPIYATRKGREPGKHRKAKVT